MRIMWPSASVLLAVFDGKQPEHVYTRTLKALERAGMLTWKSEDGGAVALTEAGRAWCVEFRRVEKEAKYADPYCPECSGNGTLGTCQHPCGNAKEEM